MTPAEFDGDEFTVLQRKHRVALEEQKWLYNLLQEQHKHLLKSCNLLADERDALRAERDSLLRELCSPERMADKLFREADTATTFALQDERSGPTERND